MIPTPLPLPSPAQPRAHGAKICRLQPDHADWPALEAFVQRQFWRHYQAQVQLYLPEMLAVQSADGRPLAALGFRAGQRQPFFVERYLDSPLEQVLSAHSGQPVERATIAEVGSLASVDHRALLSLFRHLASHLHRQCQARWLVCTVCPRLLALFQTLGLPVSLLQKADPARMGAELPKWGRYYQHEPVILVGDIGSGYQRLLEGTR